MIRIQAQTCGGSDVGTGFLLSPTLLTRLTTSSMAHPNRASAGRREGCDRHCDPSRGARSRACPLDAPTAGYHFTLATRPPQVGESVAAFGFPLGLPLTVTKGSVSGLVVRFRSRASAGAHRWNRYRPEPWKQRRSSDLYRQGPGGQPVDAKNMDTSDRVRRKLRRRGPASCRLED